MSILANILLAISAGAFVVFMLAAITVFICGCVIALSDVSDKLRQWRMYQYARLFLGLVICGFLGAVFIEAFDGTWWP